jgi:hypothetical protein
MSAAFEEVRSVRIVCDPALKNGVFGKLEELNAPGFTGGRLTEKVIEKRSRTCKRSRVGSEASEAKSESASRSGATFPSEKIVAYCQGSQFRGIGMIAGVEPFWIHRDEAAKFAER